MRRRGAIRPAEVAAMMIAEKLRDHASDHRVVINVESVVGRPDALRGRCLDCPFTKSYAFAV